MMDMDDGVNVNAFWCHGGGLDLNCGNDEVEPMGSMGAADFLAKIGRAFMFAFWIHFAFFVAELAMLLANPDPARRKVVDGFAHILVMPLTILSFYNSDTMGQLLFFAALWHFFSDTSATRPTYALLLPGFGGRTTAMDAVRWFEACWILAHHVAIGTVKFAVDWGLVETPREPWGPVFLLVFLVGAGLAHTAFGLDSFGIRGGGYLLALSQVLRIGADVAMSQYSADHSRYVDWVVLMRGDLCWLGVMFAIRGAVAYLSASGSAVTNSRDADAALAALCRGPPPDEKRGLPMAPELSQAPLATRGVRISELAELPTMS